MSWTNALGLCPRCEGPVDQSQQVCSRCGLLLVAPEFLTKRLTGSLETGVLASEVVSPPKESRLPAVLVISVVVVLAAAMGLPRVLRPGNNAQATPGKTPTSAQAASVPTRLPKSMAEVSGTSRTPTALVAVHTPIPEPSDTPSPSPPPSTPSPASTDTPLPPSPTTTAVAESQPEVLLSGVGSYAGGLNGWWVKLDGTGSRAVLWSPEPDTMHEPEGTFWLMYLVYRNDSSTPRALVATVDFTLKGSDGRLYPEYSGGGKDPQRKKIATAMQANTLDFVVAPGQRTATVLVFDMPADVQPEQLIARPPQGNDVSPAATVAWNLGKVP